MPQIILKEKAAYLGSYTFLLQEMLINIKTQLHQPPKTFSQNTYHRLFLSCGNCKVYKKEIFYRTRAEAVVCTYSSK